MKSRGALPPRNTQSINDVAGDGSVEEGRSEATWRGGRLPAQVSMAVSQASKRYRDAYGHTPLSTKEARRGHRPRRDSEAKEEDIPWDCRRLVIGTGAEGGLPALDEVRKEAHLRKVELLSLPTKAAIAILAGGHKDTNAILHVTC